MLQTAAQAATVLASVTIIFAVIAYRREIRGQNLAGLFELHQYLAKDNFAEARRVSLTRLAYTPLEAGWPTPRWRSGPMRTGTLRTACA